MAALRVLVTGATSGLGREMAVQLGRRGLRVAVTGRREELLAGTAELVKAAGGECLTLAGDVSEPARVRAHYAAIRERWGGLDWAILNAGIGLGGDALHFDAELLRKTFSVNVLGAAHWLEAVLPDMIAQGGGTVAGVSSLAAFRALPGRGPYAASKAALSALLEAARIELRGTGVRVVTICPGFIKSELTDRNDPKDMVFLLSTEDGARRALAAVEKGKSLAAFPWQLALPARFLLPWIPDWLYDRLAARYLWRVKQPPRS